MKIFNQQGEPVDVADVIYDYIKHVAETTGEDIQDVYLGVDVGFPKGKPIWIEEVKSEDNGYDGLDLIDLNFNNKTTKTS